MKHFIHSNYIPVILSDSSWLHTTGFLNKSFKRDLKFEAFVRSKLIRISLSHGLGLHFYEYETFSNCIVLL